MVPNLFRYEEVTEGTCNLFIFEDKPTNKTISMKTSRWDFSIDMVVHGGIFKNNQNTPSPVLPTQKMTLSQ